MNIKKPKVLKTVMANLLIATILTSCSHNETSTIALKKQNPVKMDNKIATKASNLNKEYWRHRHFYKFKECTEDFKHIHKYTEKKHKHYLSDGCQWGIDIKKKNKVQQVDIRSLQKKLKEKGYYRGSINGVVNLKTQKALQKYLKDTRK